MGWHVSSSVGKLLRIAERRFCHCMVLVVSIFRFLMQIPSNNKVALPVSTAARSDATGRRALLDFLLGLEELGHTVRLLKQNIWLLLTLRIHKLQGIYRSHISIIALLLLGSSSHLSLLVVVEFDGLVVRSLALNVQSLLHIIEVYGCLWHHWSRGNLLPEQSFLLAGLPGHCLWKWCSRHLARVILKIFVQFAGVLGLVSLMMRLMNLLVLSVLIKHVKWFKVFIARWLG